MGTPIHGEVDPNVTKQPCLSKHYAHTPKRASMRKQKKTSFFVSFLSFEQISCDGHHPMHTPVKT